MNILLPEQVRAENGGAKWLVTETGLYIPPSILQRPHNRPTCVDLFSGVGGFSCGVIQAGFQVVAACDNDEAAVFTYMVNLATYPCKMHFLSEADEERFAAFAEKWAIVKGKNGGVDRVVTAGSSGYLTSLHPDTPGVPHIFFGDVRKLTGQMILDVLGMEQGEIDLVCGGPPCQGFSTAGKRDVMDPRNSLVFEFVRLVLELQPKSMVMENVVGMVSMVTPEGLPVIDAIARALEDGGFGVYDALRKSLLATAGVGAALSGRRKGKTKKEEEKEADLPAQVEGVSNGTQLTLGF